MKTYQIMITYFQKPQIKLKICLYVYEYKKNIYLDYINQ